MSESLNEAAAVLDLIAEAAREATFAVRRLSGADPERFHVERSKALAKIAHIIDLAGVPYMPKATNIAPVKAKPPVAEAFKRGTIEVSGTIVRVEFRGRPKRPDPMASAHALFPTLRGTPKE